MDQLIANTNSSTYMGSRTFTPLATKTGLSIDQFNFLLSEMLALIFGIFFRRFLPPKPNNTAKRHFFGMILFLIKISML